MWGSISGRRGYFVSTVGRDEAAIREYIRTQEEGGQAPGSAEPVALKATFRWPIEPGPRQRPRAAALSGSHPKAPGFAGGYLLALARRRGIGVQKLIERRRVEGDQVEAIIARGMRTADHPPVRRPRRGDLSRRASDQVSEAGNDAHLEEAGNVADVGFAADGRFQASWRPLAVIRRAGRRILFNEGTLP